MDVNGRNRSKGENLRGLKSENKRENLTFESMK